MSCSNVLHRTTVLVLALSTSHLLKMALFGMALSTYFSSVIRSCDLVNDLNKSCLHRDKKRIMQMHFCTTSIDNWNGTINEPQHINTNNFLFVADTKNGVV